MNWKSYIVRSLFSFEGRMGRGEYWLYNILMFFAVIIFMGPVVLFSIGSIKKNETAGPVFSSFLILVPAIWSYSAMAVKRCHDRNRSGAFIIISFIPILCLWYMVEIFFLRGVENDNIYGPGTKQTVSGQIPVSPGNTATIADNRRLTENHRVVSNTADQYFEVPFPVFGARCSDNQCPCPETPIGHGEGYLYISQEVVNNRRNARTETEANALADRLKREYEKKTGAVVMIDFKDILTPILMCEQGARLRGLDMETAASDAKYWWETGKVRLRPTPIR